LAWGSFMLGVALLLIAGVLGAVHASRTETTTESTRT
jgi:hypothetical protein